MMRMVTTPKATITFDFGEGNIVTKTLEELLLIIKTETEELPEERKAKIQRSGDQASPSLKHHPLPKKEKKKVHCAQQQPVQFVLPKL